jgi:hypothetical protein
MRKHLGWTVFVFILLLIATPAIQADIVLQLKSAKYDPVAGVWMDSSGGGNDATATTSPPTLNPGQTLNGSAVVTFDGTNFLTMTPGIVASGFTCFAYVRPNSGDSRTIVGGDSGSFQYRIGGDGFGDMQEVLQRNQVRLGVSNTNVDTVNFSVISVTYAGGGGGSFRLAETGDGSAGSLFFSAPTNLIGAASGPGELYNGDIAEIRLYNTVLSDADRAAIEEEIRLTYEPM